MTDFVDCTCHVCGLVFGLQRGTDALFRSSGQTFYCPLGHGAIYRKGPTEADKMRLERDRLKQRMAEKEDELRVAWATANQQVEYRRAAERTASAMKGQVTKLKKRAAAGVCPCCNRTFVDLARHMAGKHPTFLAEEILPEGATVQ